MPGGDGTGPMGRGPMTGRGLGLCAGYSSPGYTANSGYGRGFGRGWGRGFGRGYWGRGRGFWWRGYRDPYYWHQPYDIGSYPQPSKDEEKTYLEEMIKDLEEEIKNIRNRIQELSKEKKESP